jgi:hypothetical protein
MKRRGITAKETNLQFPIFEGKFNTNFLKVGGACLDSEDEASADSEEASVSWRGRTPKN